VDDPRKKSSGFTLIRSETKGGNKAPEAPKAPARSVHQREKDADERGLSQAGSTLKPPQKPPEAPESPLESRPLPENGGASGALGASNTPLIYGDVVRLKNGKTGTFVEYRGNDIIGVLVDGKTQYYDTDEIHTRTEDVVSDVSLFPDMSEGVGDGGFKFNEM